MGTVKTITIDQLKPGMFVVGMDQSWYRTPFLFHKRLVRHLEDIDLLRRFGIKEVTIDPRKGLDLEEDSSEEALQPDSAEENTDPLQPPDTGEDALPSSTHKQATTQATAAAEGDSPKEAPRSDRDAETNADPLPPPVTQEDAWPSRAQVQTAAQETTAKRNSSEEDCRPDSAEKNAKPLQPPLMEGNAPTPSNAREQAAAAEATYTEATCSMERMFEELEAGIIPRPDTLRMVVGNVLSRVLDNSTAMLSLLYLQKMQRFDRTLASHALDVCTLSLIVGHTSGVQESELDALGAGALLHDIGYVRLPRNLYRKNHELTEQENAVMQQHPTLGLAILREAHEDREAVLRIVGEHHECSDGSGVPHKLKGDALSSLAQLVGLVDVYDGMISRRGGHPAMLPHNAIRQLFRLGDTGQFAKDLIESVIRSLGVYPIGSLVLLNTAEQAVVVAVNPAQRLKPVVKVITGPQGGTYLTPIRVDLAVQAAGASARTIANVLNPLHEQVNVALFLDGIEPEAA
jgi:putative nucleotidyltransferase with HDIG domain